MLEIYPSLYLVGKSAVDGHTPRTYLLRRAAGNILFGTKADVVSEVPAMLALGPMQFVLLGDRHHAAAHTENLAKKLNAPLLCSKIEAAVLKKSGLMITVPKPLERMRLADDLEIIPTPGHTKGALSYLWTHLDRRYLFVGDTLVPVAGHWQYWVNSVGRAAMRETVARLAEIPFDVILSNSFAATPVAWLELDSIGRKDMFSSLASDFAR